MTDVVEALRDFACHLLPAREAYGDEIDMLNQAANEIERLRAALEKVVVAGNHLVDVIGVRHPAAGHPHDHALAYYGPGNKYDVWCCWNAIMEARTVLEGK